MRLKITYLTVALISTAVLLSNTTPSTAAPVNVVAIHVQVKPPPPDINNTLRALAKLEHYGYTIDSPQQADRAIRHWQKVNGLVIDGIVGPQTLDSLGLPITASAPAVRLNPPEPQVLTQVGHTPAEIENLIRSTWPAELADKAVRIAKRESNLVPTARNSCCWGLFQIFWNVHRGWLSDMGVTDPHQLLDPATNVEAALALYYRALDATGNGWQPWGG